MENLISESLPKTLSEKDIKNDILEYIKYVKYKFDSVVGVPAFRLVKKNHEFKIK